MTAVLALGLQSGLGFGLSTSPMPVSVGRVDEVVEAAEQAAGVAVVAMDEQGHTDQRAVTRR